MKTKFLDYIDFDRVNILLEGFNQSTGFVTAILDLDGNVLSKSGWRQICTEFHRKNPEAASNCIISDTVLANNMREGEKYHFYKCINGLVDVAVPIVIKGEHVANLFSGQFIFEEPDVSFFKNQAKIYGFDENSYLKALIKVPVVSREEVRVKMNFLLSITQMITELTFEKFEQIELNEAREKSEAALRVSETRYRNLFLNNYSVQLIIDSESGQIFDANSTACHFYGLTLEELKSKKLWDINPSEIHFILEKLKESFERGTHLVFTKHLLSNGEIRDVEVFSGRAEMDGRKLVHAIVHDITERKKAEYKLIESEEKHRLLTENSLDVIWTADLEGNLTYVSPVIEKLVGFTPEDIRSMSMSDCIVREDYEALMAMLAEELAKPPAERTRSVIMEARYKTKDNRLVYAEINASWYKDGQGNFIGIQGSTRDITERKQAEKALRESHQRIEKVLKNEVVGVLFWDVTSGYMTDANETFLNLMGYSRQDLDARKLTWQKLTPQEYHDLSLAEMQKFKETGRIGPYEKEYLCKDGTRKWLLFAGNSLDGNMCVEFCVDISEKKQAKDEAYRQAHRAEALLRISSHLNAELELNKVYNTICEEACRALHTKMSAYLSYDSTTRSFQLTASSGLPDELSQALEPLNWEAFEILFKKLGTAGVIPDISAVPELQYTQTLLSQGIQSIAYSLVERDGLPLGILIVGNIEKIDFTKDYITFLSGLTNQAASAVTNARLFKETKDRLSQVRALRNIDLAIIDSIDIRVPFQVILDEVIKTLQTDAAAILRLDPHTGTLKYEHWLGFRTKDIKKTIIPLGQGYGGRTALERKSIYIHDLREGEQDSLLPPFITNEGFVAYYAVPLIAKGTVLGVLEVYHRDPLVSNGEWQSFLETLAGQAAIAIDNAELFLKLERSNSDLLQAYDATIEGWAHALDLKDEETEHHSRRVTDLTLHIAEKMGVKVEYLIHIRRGALLHDIGKMGIPDSILLKPGKLTDEEWEIMSKHPKYAFDMLSKIEYLYEALEIPYCHHEKWDGGGYPRGLKGEQIPLSARIFAVVDVYDALTSDRPYRKAWTWERTLEHIRELSGTHFDPQVVDVFLKEVRNMI